MALYKIKHGSIKMASGWFGPAQLDVDGKPKDVVDLDPKEAAQLDPSGVSLQLKDEYDLEVIGEKAKADAIEKHQAAALAAAEKAKADAIKKASAGGGK